MPISDKELFKNYASVHFSKAHKNDYQDFNLYFQKNYLPLLGAKTERILDVGCGLGHFLYFLRENGYSNFEGIDICEEEVKICRNLKLGKTTTISVEKFLRNKKKTRYDTIVLNDIIEHWEIDQSIGYLKDFFGLLTDKGKIIVKTLNIANPITGAGGRYVCITHKTGFTEESLAQILNISGYKSVRILPQKLYYKNNPVWIIASIISSILQFKFKILTKLFGRKTTNIFTKDIIGIGYKNREQK